MLLVTVEAWRGCDGDGTGGSTDWLGQTNEPTIVNAAEAENGCQNEVARSPK